MSKGKHGVCPNCGYSASHNYCAECGQPTHLHDDTFAGLIGHFFGHYFHFESRFWRTLSVLMAQPGALTVAYEKKQRARYIDPISLFIFISISVFLLIYIFTAVYGHFQAPAAAPLIVVPESPAVPDMSHMGFWQRAWHVYLTDQLGDPIWEKIDASALKIFLFTSLFFVFLLRLMYFRRKEISLAAHTIFALHFLSFWYLTLIPAAITPDSWFGPTILLSCGAAAIYLVAALRRVYGTRFFPAVFRAFTMFFLFLLLILTTTALLFSVLANMQYAPH